MRGALLAAVLALAGQAAALQSLPRSSGVPPLTGRVVDLADVLDPATEAALVAQLSAHEDSTSNQVVVLTVQSLEGEVLEAVATRVFRAWGLGQEGRDNGVLLLIAVDDRELRIEVGYGLEGSLTDATSGSIIRNEIVPRFRDGDFDGGVLAGTEAILQAIVGTYEPAADGGGASPLDSLLTWALVLVFFLVGVLFPVAKLGGTGWKGDLLSGGLGALSGAVAGFLLWAMLGLLWLVPGLTLLLGVVLIGLNRWLEGHPTWGPKRRHERAKQAAFRKAQRSGASRVVVDGHSYAVPSGSSGGGGFSGGGGSSGGGGASGSW